MHSTMMSEYPIAKIDWFVESLKDVLERIEMMNSTEKSIIGRNKKSSK